MPGPRLYRVALTLSALAVAVAPACDDDPTQAGAGSTPTALSCDPGETRACYGGPNETEDVGLCKGGVEACLQHGRGWGPCVGQVLPVQENCDAPDDENCDGLTSCGQTIWANRMGVDRDEVVYRLATDALGAIYLGGFYRAAIDLGGGELPITNNTRDLLVAKLTEDGEHVWSVGLHGDTHLQPQSIAVTPDGTAVVLVANVNGDVVAGATTIPSNGDNDILITKLTGDGTIDWVRRFGDDQEQVPTGVAFDDAGNIIVTGYFDGEIDFGGAEPLTSAGFNRDAFVAKLDPAGDEVWSRVYNGPLDQIPRDVAVTSTGRILVTGRISGRVDFGGGELVAAGTSSDIFLLALDPDGEHLYSRVWGGEGNDEAWAVAGDSGDNALITGRFESEVRFGASLLDAIGAGAIVVAKVDEAGDDVWAQRIGGASEQGGTDLAIDSRDRVVVTGYYEGDVGFGEATLPPSGLREPNILVAKLEPSGAPVWARGIAVDGNQDVGGVGRGWRSVALLPGDFIALGGFVQREIDFGDGPLEDRGGADLLVAQLAP